MVIGGGHERRLEDLEPLIAWYGADPVGAATYVLEPGCCELVSINTVPSARRHGAGSALLNAVEQAGRAAGAERLRIYTTNDNLDALRFYQRRGCRIVAVRPGAVDEARVMKPSIPEVGDSGIPIRDVLELEKALVT
jgi:ribosomal protein S18 acetylase RimI-like enzyme